MLLSRDFLLKALSNAKFYCNGIELKKDDLSWSFNKMGQDVQVAFDSRMVVHGAVFFALKGQTADGHEFLNSALENGVACFVVSKEPMQCFNSLKSRIADRLIIFVPDTYQALVDLAKAWRDELNIPIVGITGSIGKTSTKEILRSILQQTDISFYISAKNQNTFIGLCANILNISSQCKVAVLEVGTSEPGEMAIKSDILRPTIGLITKISYSHLSQFGTLQNIANEKRQLFKNFKEHEIGVIFGDQVILTEFCYHHPTARFGFKTKNHVQARKIRIASDENCKFITEFVLRWYGQKAKVKFNNLNQALLSNALAASTIAYFLHVPFCSVINGIESYTGFANRFEQKNLKNNLGTVISDCYNANPETMKAAISAFDKMRVRGKKIAVIGDMLELGTREIYWHRNLGKLLNKASSINSIILVGNLVKYTHGILNPNIPVVWVKDWMEAQGVLNDQLKKSNSFVLFKASHGIALDKLVDKIVA